jgi:hypothetical protein
MSDTYYAAVMFEVWATRGQPGRRQPHPRGGVRGQRRPGYRVRHAGAAAAGARDRVARDLARLTVVSQ